MSNRRSPLDEQWHRDHVLGSKAPMDKRVEWHLEHARVCGCREVPASVRAEIEARGGQVPDRREKGE